MPLKKDELPPFEDTLPVDELPPAFDDTAPVGEIPPFEESEPIPFKLSRKDAPKLLEFTYNQLKNTLPSKNAATPDTKTLLNKFTERQEPVLRMPTPSRRERPTEPELRQGVVKAEPVIRPRTLADDLQSQGEIRPLSSEDLSLFGPGGRLDRTVAGTAGQMITGAGQFGELAGRGAQNWAEKFGDNDALNLIGKFIEKGGKAVSGTGRDIVKQMAYENPGNFEKVVGAFTSGASFFIPGLGISRMAQAMSYAPRLAVAFGIGGSSLMESGLEAGMAREDAINMGKSSSDADKIASRVFMMNIPITTLGNKLGIFAKTNTLPGKFAQAYLAEGTQEALQQFPQNIMLDRPTMEGVGESFALGGLVGGVMGVGEGLLGVQGGQTGTGVPFIPVSPTISPAALDRARAMGATDPLAALKSVTPAAEWGNIEALGTQVAERVAADESVPMEQKQAVTAQMLGTILEDSLSKTPKAPVDVDQEAIAQQQVVADDSEAVIKQVVTEHEAQAKQIDEAWATRQALTTPHPVAGKPVVAMSEAEFGKAVRESGILEEEQPSGAEISEAYDEAMQKAKDLSLTDDREIERLNAEELQTEAERETAPDTFDLMEEDRPDVVPVSQLSFEEASARFPGLTEDQHRSMVKAAVDAYELAPENVPYEDIKGYATTKVKTEATEQFAKDEVRTQIESEGHATPILNMLWRSKFDPEKVSDWLGGEINKDDLRGYFRKGGLSVELATRRAWQEGWIPENDENLFTDRLNEEVRKRDAVKERGQEATVLREEKEDYQPEESLFRPQGDSLPQPSSFRAGQPASEEALQGVWLSLQGLESAYLNSIRQEPRFVKGVEKAAKIFEKYAAELGLEAIPGNWQKVADYIHEFPKIVTDKLKAKYGEDLAKIEADPEHQRLPEMATDRFNMMRPKWAAKSRTSYDIFLPEGDILRSPQAGYRPFLESGVEYKPAPEDVQDEILEQAKTDAKEEGFTDDESNDYRDFVEERITDLSNAWAKDNTAKGQKREVVHSLNITNQLRQVAITEGFPLFEPGHVYKPEELLKNEAEALPAGAQERAVTDTRQVRPIGQAHDLRMDPAINQINKDLMKKQFSSVIGKMIKTIQDVAEIAAFVRHPFIEHLAVIKLKKGKIIGSLVLTDGKMTSVDPDFGTISNFLQDADEFYMSHNHPTGNSTPSGDDVASAKRWGKIDKRFKGHVVTDHKTYTAITPDGKAIAQKFRDEKLSFRPEIEKMEKTPAVVGWTRKVLQGDRLGIMFVDNQLQVMSFDQVDPQSNYNVYVKQHAKDYGSTGVFMVVGESAFNKMKSRALVGGYHDFLVLKSDGSYKSARLGQLKSWVIDFMGDEYGWENYYSAGRFSEPIGKYNPEDYNKMTGRWQPGMTLTLKARLITPYFRAGLLRGTTGKLISVDLQTGRMLAEFEGQILEVTPDLFKETYREPGTPQPGQKERKFIDTVRGMEKTKPTVKDSIAGNYDVISNEETLAEGTKLITEDMNRAYMLANETGEPTRLSNTVAMLLIDRFQSEGRYQEAINLIEHTAERCTKAGQAIQALAMYRRLTPEGILRYAASVVRKAQKAGNFGKLLDELRILKDDVERMAFAKKHKIPYLSVEKANEICDMAKRISTMEQGRARDLETAKMLLKISELTPKTIWDKISSLQILAQLLNPKTFIRNMIGNTAFMAFENFSQVVGVPLDMLVGKVYSGRRSIAMPGFMTQLNAGWTGLKEGIEESLAGVELQQINNKFDLPRGSAFDSKVLKFLEKALNISLKATDKAFYKSAFEDSLRGQMKLAKANAPTPEMVQIAHMDGLYRTFNDPNALRSAFTWTKKAFNLGKTWGMGDMIIKYPGTPASLLMRGVEYSPFNFLQAVYIFAKAGSKTDFNQREFVQQTSRALTGTGLLVGTGMILSALGLIRGKDDDKKRLRETEAAIGVKDYQLNVSGIIRFLSSGMDPKAAVMRKDDLLISYDWMQPASINLAMGANLQRGAETSGVNVLADAVEAAGTTLQEQPLVSGVARVFRTGSFIEGIEKTVEGIPASFVPTLLNQVKQLTDNVSRNTRTDSALGGVANMVRVKMPGLSKTLPPRVDVLGRVRQVYQNNTNNAFNVFLNPAFVTRYNPTPTTNMVLDIWLRTGDTIQLPRFAPRQITVRGVKRPLTEMEQAQFQHYIGEVTSKRFSQLSQNREFMAAPDGLKAKFLQSELSDIYGMAKWKVLGIRE